MKKNNCLSLLTFLLFVSALLFSACKNDDDSPSAEPAARVTFDNVNDAAYTVLRSLTDLTEYDENKAVNLEDNSVSGIETLPDDWSSRTFTCDEGFVLDSTKPTVRSLPVNGLGEALEFFSGVIGEPVSEDSLTNGVFEWSYSGLGTLKFTKVTVNDNLFATMDVSISVMPGLTQLKFISKDAPELTSANSYSGLSYYHAGDIIQRKKDKTYWICVRPSGGPYKKDKSYWISLDAFNNTGSGPNNGSTTIKGEKKKVDIFYDVGRQQEGQYEEFEQDWYYAKNLMSLKTAKAAFHTFATLVNGSDEKATAANNALKEMGINLLALHRDADSKDGPSEAAKAANDYSPAAFCFAYGSPKKDSNRDIKLNRLNKDRYDPDVFKTVGQVNYVQPFLSGKNYIKSGKIQEDIATVRIVDTIENTSSKNKSFLYSLTDSFDSVFLWLTSSYTGDFTGTTGSDNKAKAQEYLYNFYNYLARLKNAENPSAPGPLEYIDYTHNYAKYQPTLIDWHVIVATELMIKDNKGSANAEKRPVGSEYSDIYLQKSNSYFDYWKTFDNCERTVDGKKVDWKKEND